jgi:LPS sulfotransferase NodH
VTAAGRFDELNAVRRGAYVKDASAERFMEELNAYLEPREQSLYLDLDVEHPLVFVMGLPRSGTTLLTQLLAYCLDAGYMNNVSARFWLAPVHGVRLARQLLGEHPPVSFESDHARTRSLGDIHEFGYFWRRWLDKHTFDDVVHAAEREDAIDWPGLRRALANIQHEFGRALVAKNMLGAYHIPRMRRELGPVIYVLIERDPLDVAVSILDARRKYYDDPDRWWSYVPVEYPQLEHLDHRRQIAGQIHFLRALFARDLAQVDPACVVNVSYPELCRRPASVLDLVRDRARALGHEIPVRQAPPESFPLRTRQDREQDRQQFAELLARFAAGRP